MKRLPLSLYVHLPWCVKKCPYCDFNSYTAGSNMQRGRYVDALLTPEGILVTWQQGQEDGSQPLVGRLVPMERIERILAGR